MYESFLQKGQSVRRKVLWPLAVTLVVFLILFLIVFQAYLQRELTRHLDSHIDFVDTLYRDFLDERSATMLSLISLIRRDDALAQAMRDQNREELFRIALPLFNEPLQDQEITHFYFHNPDGTNFLRVHKPERFGDRIGRKTLTTALKNLTPSSGAEIGPLGTFTLRVVVPWQVDGKLIGFIELGEEVEPLIDQIADQANSQLAIMIDKNLLDKNLWQEGQKMLGRRTNWNLLAGHVVNATTDLQLLDELPRVMALASRNSVDLEIRLKGSDYRGRTLPIIGAGKQSIGLMVIFQNINSTLTDHRKSMLLVALFCMLLGSALFISSYIILGRTDKTLKVARQKLLDEIEKTLLTNKRLKVEIADKNHAERALQRAHDKLEQRVAERTRQLDQQNDLLEKSLAEARRSKDRISGVMRSVDDAIFVVDADDRILFINNYACSLFGVQQGEVLGEPISSAIKDSSLRNRFLSTLNRKVGGREFDFEINQTSQQSPQIMHAKNSILNSPEGKYEGMIFLARDVTRNRSMDRLKSDFISVAAHELSTPLTAMLGFSELLLEKNALTEQEQTEYLQIIHEKTVTLTRLLNEMLDISRIESGRKLELFFENCRVTELFEPVVRQYQKKARERDIKINLAQPDLFLRVDTAKISQVMENLLSNAMKYSPAESTIQLFGEAENDSYHLVLRDQGIGMTPEQLRHAFDKFYRGDNADRAIKGTGLGLTITRHIIEEHNGEIWLKSQLNEGTEVHILLPLSA